MPILVGHIYWHLLCNCPSTALVGLQSVYDVSMWRPSRSLSVWKPVSALVCGDLPAVHFSLQFFSGKDMARLFTSYDEETIEANERKKSGGEVGKGSEGEGMGRKKSTGENEGMFTRQKNGGARPMAGWCLCCCRSQSCSVPVVTRWSLGWRVWVAASFPLHLARKGWWSVSSSSTSSITDYK